MTTIHLTTTIKASNQIVFDVSRNIDIHQQSASKSKEIAIAGVFIKNRHQSLMKKLLLALHRD